MKRKRLWIAVGAAVAFIAIASTWFLLRDTPDKVGHRVAHAWASGDVRTILKYAPPAERAVLSESQLRAAYQRAILDEFGKLSLKSLEKDKPSRRAAKVVHTFVATYAMPNGTDFDVEITVYEKKTGITCEAMATLLRLYDGEAISRGLATGEYDGSSYETYIKISSANRKRAARALREAGITQIYLGEVIPLD